MTVSDITAHAPLVFAAAVALGVVGGLVLLIVAQIGRQLGPGRASSAPASSGASAVTSTTERATASQDEVPVLREVVTENVARRPASRTPVAKPANARASRPATRLDDPLAAAAAEGLGAFVVSDDAALAEMRALREGAERFEAPDAPRAEARAVEPFIREHSPQDERRDAVLSGQEDRADNVRATARVEPDAPAAPARGRALSDAEYDPSDFASRRDDSGPGLEDRPMRFGSSFGID